MSNGPRSQWLCHHSAAMPNGRDTAQAAERITIPTITAVPTRPSPIPRTERGRMRISTTSVARPTIVPSSQIRCRPFS